MNPPARPSSDPVASVQHAILEGLRRGGAFGTVHKEGGTDIFWRGGEYIRRDYGDNPGERRFTDEGPFLGMLREFFHADVMYQAGSRPLTELEVWQQILRRLVPPKGRGFSGGGPRRPAGTASRGTVAVGVVAATALTIVFAKARATLSGRAPVAGIDLLFYPSLVTLGVVVLISAFWLRRNWR